MDRAIKYICTVVHATHQLIGIVDETAKSRIAMTTHRTFQVYSDYYKALANLKSRLSVTAYGVATTEQNKENLQSLYDACYTFCQELPTLGKETYFVRDGKTICTDQFMSNALFFKAQQVIYSHEAKRALEDLKSSERMSLAFVVKEIYPDAFKHFALDHAPQHERLEFNEYDSNSLVSHLETAIKTTYPSTIMEKDCLNADGTLGRRKVHVYEEINDFGSLK